MKLKLVERRRDPQAPRRSLGRGPAGLAGVRGLAAGLGLPGWTVDVVLVDDADMEELNRDFRGGDGVTDVLSFSYLETEGAGRAGPAAGRRARPRPPSGSRPSRRRRPTRPKWARSCWRRPSWTGAAASRAGTWPHEWPLLVVHGCLHILGWVHDSPAERAAMQAVEARLLADRGLPHPLRGRS